MSDEDDPELGLPEDELLSALDSWGDMFDDLHDDAPPIEEAIAAPLPDDELLGEPEALGSLLGAPPPLPPIDDGGRRALEGGSLEPATSAAPPQEYEEDVYTSAKRPSQTVLQAGPTDEELFGDLPDELPISALTPNRHADAAEAAAEFDAPQLTRVAGPEMAKLVAASENDFAESVPELTRIAVPDTALLAAVKRGAEEPARTGPALVRRDELERRRQERAFSEDGLVAGFGDDSSDDYADEFGGESTRIADHGQLQQLMAADAEAANAAAEALFAAADAPALELTLDEDFYADIEISSATLPSLAELEEAENSSVRRTTANLVRRPMTEPPIAAPDDAEGLVVELEAEPAARRFRGGSVAGGEVDAVTPRPRPSPLAEPSVVAEGARPFATAASAAVGEGDPEDLVLGDAGGAAAVVEELEVFELELGGAGATAAPATRDEHEIELGNAGAAPWEPSSPWDELEAAARDQAAAQSAQDADEPVAAVDDVSTEVLPARPSTADDEPTPVVPAARSERVTADYESAAADALAADGTQRDAAPGLYAAPLPELNPKALELPEELPVELADASEERAATLLLYERELEVAGAMSDPRLRLAAAQLAEQLDDLDRAQTHFEAALRVQPLLPPAKRGLRRLARRRGAPAEALALLDTELAHASQLERRGLRAHRADLLTASGALDAARAATQELVDEAPDVRALIARLELAFAADESELCAAMEELAAALAAARQADSELATPAVPTVALAASLYAIAGLGRELIGADDSAAAYDRALQLEPSLRMALAGRGRLRADADAALATLADSLADRVPRLAAAHGWRASLRAASPEPARDYAVRAVALDSSPVLLGRCAAACAEVGDRDGELTAQAALALAARTPHARARAAMRTASLLAVREGGARDAAAHLRAALRDDPHHPAAIAALRELAAADPAVQTELDRAAIIAEPAGAVLARVRLAKQALADEDAGAAAELLLEAHAGGRRSAASAVIDELLVAALTTAGRLEEAAALLAERASDPGSLDPGQAQVRAARAAEALAQAADAAWRQEPSVAARASARAAAYASALDAWQRVLDRQPDLQDAHAASRRLAAQLGDDDVLEEVLARQQQAVTPARAASLAVMRARLGADPARGVEVARAALEHSPLDARLTVALLVNAARISDWDQAAAALEDVATALETAASETDEAPPGEPLAALARLRAATLLIARGEEPTSTAPSTTESATEGRAHPASREPLGAPTDEHAAALLAEVVAAQPQFAPAADALEELQRRHGRALEVATPSAATGVDDFARLVRDAEHLCDNLGDPARAVELYLRALTLRPSDPLAREGLWRAGVAAGEAAPLAELALRDLERASSGSDSSARADAYELLATIDQQLRGDEGSALLAWQSAVAADPTRLPAWRALERAYLQSNRVAELYEVYGRYGELLAADATAAAMALERARLARLLARPSSELNAELRRAAAPPPMRIALFHLEAQAREAGPSDELAALEETVAEYFAADPRGRAAFLTRAGETRMMLGQLDAAIDHFRTAAGMAGDSTAAFEGWREAALRGQLWLDVAESAERSAALADGPAERAALLHFAAVALMDRATNGERAARLLRQVLALEPRHRDAFLRLRMLLDEQGEHEALAALLAARVPLESAATVRIALHRELAALYRNVLEDRDAAKAELRALLTLRPSDRSAIAELSELAWEQGAWAEAAEALIVRARTETDPAVLKGVFYRLGILYADHLPDARWATKSFQKVLSFDPADADALDHLARVAAGAGDWRTALAACERLVKLGGEPEVRVGYLHRMAGILESGFGDRGQAERAYRAALELAPHSAAALQGLASFYHQTGELQSLRVHLDRLLARMRTRIVENPFDAEAHRVIARAMLERERAGVRGSRAVARYAAELASALDHPRSELAGDAELTAVLAADAPGAAAVLANAEHDDLLFPAAVPAALRQLLLHLGDRIAKHLALDLRSLGIARGDRLRPERDPQAAAVVAQVQRVATQLGIRAVEVYVADSLAARAIAVPSSPPALVIGAALASELPLDSLRFATGRALLLARACLTGAEHLEVDAFGGFLIALLRQLVPELAAAELPEAAITEQQARLRKLIPGALLSELRPYAVSLAGAPLDHRSIWMAIHRAGDRAGLVACGSATAALQVLRAGDATEERIADLIAFAVSDDHARIHASLA